MKADLLLKNATLPDGRVADIAVSQGNILHVGGSVPAFENIECSGLLCLPGATDMHVHLRDGKQRQKEDIGSGTRSALAGGVTTVVDQPNTIPAILSSETFRDRIKMAAESMYTNYALNGAVTAQADLRGLYAAGALCFGETFAAPSSYGDALGREDLIRLLGEIQTIGALATIHAEEVLDGDDINLETHNALRPPGGEEQVVQEICSIPKRPRLHFCHLSNASSVYAAMSCGTTEVSPHHLFLSYEQFEAGDTHGRVNPPLRSQAERKGLWEAWQHIDIIASDHAPHTPDEKARPFAEAPSGIPGVETMVPLLLAEVYNNKITLDDLIDKTVIRPAEILGLTPPGLTPGNSANLALFPKEIGKVSCESLHSKAGWTPYEGMPAVFPEIVIVNGTCAYHRGEFSPPAGQWIAGHGFNG